MKPKKGNRRYYFIIDTLRAIGVERSGVVVDCACGEGFGSSILMKGGMDVLGYDISPDKVSVAKERGVKAFCADICSLPCADDTADIFICSETLEHLTKSQTSKAAEEIKRVCKKSGTICITVPQNKKLCLNNPAHKQYLMKGDIQSFFDGWEIVLEGVFCKKRGRCNIVLILKSKTGD